MVEMVMDVFGEIVPMEDIPAVRVFAVTPEMREADARARAEREAAVRAPAMAWRESLRLKVTASLDEKAPVHYVFPEGRAVAARKVLRVCACGRSIYRKGAECSMCLKQESPCERCGGRVPNSRALGVTVCKGCVRKQRREEREAAGPRLCARGCGWPVHVGRCRLTEAQLEAREAARLAVARGEKPACSRGCGREMHSGRCRKPESERTEAVGMRKRMPRPAAVAIRVEPLTEERNGVVVKLCPEPGCGAALKADNTTGMCFRHAESYGRKLAVRAARVVCEAEGCERLLKRGRTGLCGVCGSKRSPNRKLYASERRKRIVARAGEVCLVCGVAIKPGTKTTRCGKHARELQHKRTLLRAETPAEFELDQAWARLSAAEKALRMQPGMAA